MVEWLRHWDFGEHLAVVRGRLLWQGHIAILGNVYQLAPAVVHMRCKIGGGALYQCLY